MMRNFTHLVKMANVDVMKMMKKRTTRKKGPKLRVATDIEELLNQVKRDPLQSLFQVQDGYFNELLHEYILSLPFSQRSQLNTFNMLRTTIPMSLSRKFIAFYRDTIETFDPRQFTTRLENFIKQPINAAKIDASKKYIKSRQIEPTKMTVRQLRQLEQQPEERIPRTILPYSGSLPQRRTGGLPFEIPDRGNIQLMNRYMKAPWMVDFVNQPVVGIAMREVEPRYFTTNIIAFEDTDGNLWYKVNKLWMSISANRQRSFIPDKVAYILRDQSIVVENEDMFNASLAFSPTTTFDIAIEPVSPYNFDIVTNLLMNNSVIKFINPDPAKRAQFVQDIIQSTGPAQTNLDLANKIGHVLLILDPYVTKSKRLFFRKLATQAIKPSDLVNVNYATAFLEWYTSDLDLNDITNLLEAKKKVVIANILRTLETRQPEVRRRQGLRANGPRESLDVAPFF